MVNWLKVKINAGNTVEVIDAKPLTKSILNGSGIALINEEGNPLLLPDLQPNLKEFMDLMIQTQQKCADTLQLLVDFQSLPVANGSPVVLQPAYITNISAKKTEIQALKTDLQTLKGNLE
jgi:vacuolar-type H+-ATPase subunit B/Vma2